MAEHPFPIDARELHFVLFEWLRVDELFGQAPFADASQDDAELVLREAWRFARERAWPVNAIGDREGCRFIDGEVHVAEPIRELYRAYVEGGWSLLTAPESVGGAAFPSSFGIAAGEIITAANLAFSPYAGLTRGVARLLDHESGGVLREVCVPRLYSGEWAGTMCLTEPHAGSAVGDLRTTATKRGDRYYLRGQKIFITGGEQDLTDNIIHLVLARTPGAPAGIKGVSLFAVPKRRFSESGELGRSNDVRCTGIEEKMGLHASATCALSFGDDDDCEGFLVGKECRGIESMFRLMNEARIGTGVHGLAAGSLAYQVALAYAKERVQGVEIDRMKDVDAPRVSILQHPDVRRMVFTMKAEVDAMRAMLYRAARFADEAKAAPDEESREEAACLLEILTPLCKSHASDAGFEVSILAMQTMGGVGYTADFPVEQIARDVKIASIYEGANGIQALDLIGRKLTKGHGALFLRLMARIEASLERAAQHDELKGLGARIADAQADVRRVTGRLAEQGMSGDMAGAALGASHYLTMLSRLVGAWLLLEQAGVACERRAGLDEDAARYYENKIATARFYVKSVLPKNLGLARIIEDGDHEILATAL